MRSVPTKMSVQSPQQTERTDHLDRRVSAKSDQGDAACDNTGTDRYDGFDDVPANREVFKPQGPAVQRNAAIRGESDHDPLGYEPGGRHH